MKEFFSSFFSSANIIVRATLISHCFYSCPYRARCSALYPFTQGVALGYGGNWAFSPHCMSFDSLLLYM